MNDENELNCTKHLQSSNYIPAVKWPADIMTPESTLTG